MTKFSLNTGNNVKPFKTIEQQLDLLESQWNAGRCRFIS